MSERFGSTSPLDGIASAASIDAALHVALLALCDRSPQVLAHAVRSIEPNTPLRPAGMLCGREALEHVELSLALAHREPPGTGLTSAVIDQRSAVWVTSIADVPSFAAGPLLHRHGITSGAAFPVWVGSALAAVVELLSSVRLDPGGVTAALADTIVHELERTTEQRWAAYAR
jgi:hypothetical protein